AERLDPGLDAPDASVAEKFDLLPCEVRLHLVEQLIVDRRVRHAGEQRLEVPMVEDVVDGEEAEVTITPRQFGQLGTHPPGRLGPERHGSAVQAAERAVMLRAPPAPARALEGNLDRAAARGRKQFQAL